MVKPRQKTKSKMQKGQKEISRKEMTRLGGALRALGGLAGGAAGSLIGMPSSGSSMGTGLGAALSRWLGSGDYAVSSNTIVQRTLRGSDSIPAMHSNNQTVTIRHKEYIGEVRGNQTFTVNDAFQINPGNSRTFPWLSGVATRFQEYRIKGMIYHYVPSSGTAVSSTDAALGTVMLVTSYRASDVAPTPSAGGTLTNNLFPGTPSSVWGDLAVVASNRKITFPKGTTGFYLITMRLYASGTYTITTAFTAPTYTSCVASASAPSGNAFRTFNDSDDIFVEVGVLIVDPAVEASVEFPAVNIPYSAASTTWLTINPFTV